jgi:hypothetical protein
MDCLLCEKTFLKTAIGLAAVIGMENMQRFGSIRSVNRQINSKKNHRQAENQAA